MVRLLAFVAIVGVVFPAIASAQEQRFSPETYQAWAADADGRACETPLGGYFVGSRAAGIEFPQAAVANRTSGDVLLIFNTRYDGALSITDARVFASEPPGVFDEVALEVAQHFRFPPEMRNCDGLRAVLWFRVNNANATGAMVGFIASAEAQPPLNAAAAEALRARRLRNHCQVEGALNPEQLGIALQSLYPARALDRSIEGYAVVEISIAPDGSVQSPVVLDEFPRGMGFGDAAASAVQTAQYAERSTTCQNAATIVHFRLR